MSTATQGRAREHKARDELISRGWLLVARSAGSKGAADLVMVHAFHGLALIQVGTGNKALGPADRDRFVALAEVCGALALLAVCVPRQPVRFYVVTRETASNWKEWVS
jgi:hypothetical protein